MKKIFIVNGILSGLLDLYISAWGNSFLVKRTKTQDADQNAVCPTPALGACFLSNSGAPATPFS